MTSTVVKAQTAFISAWATIQDRMADAHRDQRGEITSQMLLIAVFTILAIAVGAIVTAKTMGAANAIPDAPTGP